MDTPPTVQRAFGLEKVFQLFGRDISPVPCKTGTKVPAHTYKSRSLESFRSQSWLTLFEDPEAQNIAIFLGDASSGLVAVDFDRDEDWEEWDQVNNGISSRTTRSRGGRGCQVWFRIKGTVPPSCRTTQFEWRSTKNLSTITGIHPSGVPYQLLTDLPALEITLEELQWPEGWEIPWIKSQEEIERENFESRYGPPMAFGKRGGVKINQDAVAAKFKLENNLIFDGESGSFFQYEASTGLWRGTTKAVVRNHVAEQFRDLIQEMKANAEDEDEREKFTEANFAFNATVQRAVVESLEGMCHQDDWFKDKPVAIHCKNGMVDLSTGEPVLLPFHKKYLSRNATGIQFQPGATCPRFLNELLRPAIPEYDIELLQRWAGQALLGRNYHQVFLVVCGTGGGGKGTVCRVIMDIIGRKNVGQLRTNQLGDRFEIALFRTKTLLYGPDVAANFLNQTGSSNIKALTGADYMSAEMKGGNEPIELEGNFNLLVTANSRLFVRLQGDADAWSRRMLIIPFEKPKPKQVIAEFAQVLMRDEGPGILNWMIEGAKMVLEDLRHNRPFPITKLQKSRVESLLNESDSVRFFVVNCVKHSPIHADSITSDDLFEAYCRLCNANGWNIENEVRFQKKVKDMMIQTHGAGYSKNVNRETRLSTGQRGYTNCVLIDLDQVRMPATEQEFEFEPDSEQDLFTEDETPTEENNNPF